MLYYGLIIGFILGVITSFWIFGKRLESLARRGIILPGPKLPEKYKKDIHQRYFEEN